jgi:hypothetical protein
MLKYASRSAESRQDLQASTALNKIEKQIMLQPLSDGKNCSIFTGTFDKQFTFRASVLLVMAEVEVTNKK